MVKKKKNTSRLVAFYKVQGTYYANPTIKMIPKNAKWLINRISKKKLKQIHRNTLIAKERIAILLEKFHHGHLLALAGDLNYDDIDIHSNKWIQIFGRKKYLIAQNVMYEADILIKPYEISYQTGKFARSFLLDNDMIYKPFVRYILTSETLINAEISLSQDQRRIIMKNPIARSSVLTSFNIVLPTEEDLLTHAATLISDGWSNKGKKLCWEKDRRKNDRKIKKLIEQGTTKNDLPRFSYVEVSIKRFKSLTEYGYILPRVGNFKSGGRVTTSFTLMPKWIRQQLTLSNSTVIGVDYSAMHPNIASTMWGDGSNITHTAVADFLGIPVSKAKIQHLKLFNTSSTGMEKMDIYNYYKEKQPDLIDNVKATKVKTYKRTSSIMFKAEVRILTGVIVELSEMGLEGEIVYVYDELMTTPENAETVKDVMIEVARKMNYKLEARIG